MFVKICNTNLNQIVEVTLKNYIDVFNSWLCSNKFVSKQQGTHNNSQRLNAKKCVLKLEIDASLLTPDQTTLFYALLKLFQIQGYDKLVQIVINDTVEAVYKRHEQYNQININISWLWSHIGLYAMHIGYNTVSNVQTNIFEILTGIVYLCSGTGSFYVIGGKQSNYQPWKSIYEQQLNRTLQCKEFNQNSQQYELFEFENLDQNRRDIQKEISMLYIMRVGVQHQSLNPFTQLLPIFQFNLSLANSTGTKTNKIQHTEQYNDYLQTIQYFQETGKIQTKEVTKKSFIQHNNFLIPYHVSQLEEDGQRLICAKILLDQSHAFKICYMVLNLVYHQNLMCDKTTYIQNTNYVLADGSQCGKTTYDLALYYAFLFHSKLRPAPIMIQRKSSAQQQELMFYNSITIQEVDSFQYQNFSYAVQNIDMNADCIVQFNKLIKAGLQDFYSYPEFIQKIASKLNVAVKQALQAKSIITGIIDNNLLSANSFPDDTKEQIKTIENNKFVINAIHFIQGARSEKSFEASVINQFFANTYTGQKDLFVKISQLKDCFTPEYADTFLIFDEVCYKNTNINPNTYNYCQLMALITKVLKQNQNIVIKQSKQYLYSLSVDFKFSEDEKKGYNTLISEISKIEQLSLLIFPLTIFLKANFKNDLNKVLRHVTNLQLNQKTSERIKGVEFLTELASIQAFEAIMYRDLNYVLGQIENPLKTNFDKDLITSFLIESILSKQPSSNSTPQSIRDQFTKYQIKVKKFTDDYESNNKTFFLSGTFCSLNNFVRYTDMLLISSSSRGNVSRSINSCPTSSPQFHASKLQNQYYLQGIDSNQYKDPLEYFNEIVISMETIVLNLFYAMNPYMTSFVQSLYAQVSPQLIVIDPQTNNIIYSKSHRTYIQISENDKILDKIEASTMNNQLSIQKIRGEDIVGGKKQMVQQIQVFYNNFKNNCLSLSVKDCQSALKMQPLVQSNIKQLVSMGNYMINQFQEQLMKSENDIAKILLSNISFLGNPINLNESLFLLFYLFTLKYGISSKEVDKIETLLSLTIPDTLSKNTSQIFKYMINHQCVNDQEISHVKKTQQIQDSEVYLSFMAPELVQLDQSTLKQQLKKLKINWKMQNHLQTISFNKKEMKF
ncbi:Hypothetical_protein [Hexamita inflata]|uniref:Hypothetical_protein n=1 Tax=Hexamita inflata TaxID=28002 RepID=A0ABP1H9R3_9EUKA